MIKTNLKNYGSYIFFYFFSFITLFLCSHFSPLYKYNFSVDPSVYLTIGRGITNGLIPYKDLLDIKGPIIFFLFALFSLIKLGSNYFGIFILETIALWISLTFIYKTIIIFSNSKRWAIVLTLFYSIFLLNQDAFITGGEAEEFVLPFISFLIYFSINLIKNNYITSSINYLIQGITLGIVFWIKYTTIGAWLAFYICLFIILLISKKYKELIKMVSFSLLGFLVPTFMILFYFTFNHALKDLIWGYFGWNYIYGGTNKGIFKNLFFMLLHSFCIFFKRYPIIWFIVILSPYIVILNSKLIKQKSAKIMLFSMLLCNTCLEFMGGTMFPYYQLISLPSVVFTFCWLSTKLKNINISKLILIPSLSFIILICILIINPSYKHSNLTNFVPYQEKFAKIILKKDKSPSILDFNELDQGWYNYLGTLPPLKDFNKMNIHNKLEYKPYIKAQLKIIKNSSVRFVICSVSNNFTDSKLGKILLKNYKIIASHYSEKYKKNILLLEKK